jgi:hypothetical protein
VALQRALSQNTVQQLATEPSDQVTEVSTVVQKAGMSDTIAQYGGACGARWHRVSTSQLRLLRERWDLPISDDLN